MAKRPIRHRVNRRFSLPFAVVVAMGLTGCVSLPTSGDPQAFDLQIPDADPIDQVGVGPQHDSTPERLVSDFLRACAASDEFVTAGRYLTDDAAKAWQPVESVLVYPADDTPTLEVVAADQTKNTARVQVRVKVMASVDADGVFALGPNQVLKLNFELTQEGNGQWRIAHLDDGILLSRSAFLTAFQPGDLYFYASHTDTLVPDPRWLPRKRMASRLVSALLEGPSEQIRPAVSSAVTGSLSLPTKGVEIDGSNATVALVGDAELSQGARERLLRQMSATLGQISGVEKVTLELNSVQLGVSDALPEPQFGFTSMIGLKDGSIVAEDSDRSDILVSAPRAGVGVKRVAASTAAEPVIAWMGPEGSLSFSSKMGRGDVHSQSYDRAVPFAVDQWNWVWIATESDGIDVVSTENERRSLPGGPDIDVANLAISPSGLRAVFSAGGEENSILYSAVIERNDQGAPQRLINVTPMNLETRNIVDFAWSGDSKLVVLSQEDQDHRELWTVPISGFVQSTPVRVPATGVIASPLGNQVFLTDEEGHSYVKVGAIWRLARLDISFPAFPG